MKILLIGGLGYIGSFLYSFLKSSEDEVDICDDCRRGNPEKIEVKYPYDYKGLSSKEISGYDFILWFAGHSSVLSANQDPKGAIDNNMTNLIDFLKKIPNENIRFIYASTASLYTGSPGLSKEDTKVIPYENSYDISKFAFDYLAQSYHKNLIALRMGTLAGFSTNLRSELIFNQMCTDAKFKKIVNVSNKSKIRSILFLSDLTALIKIFLGKIKLESGFYNLASYSLTIEELAIRIAKFFDAKVVYQPDSPTYSFSVDTSKIERLGFKPLLSIDEQINEFQKHI